MRAFCHVATGGDKHTLGEMGRESESSRERRGRHPNPPRGSRRAGWLASLSRLPFLQFAEDGVGFLFVFREVLHENKPHDTGYVQAVRLGNVLEAIKQRFAGPEVDLSGASFGWFSLWLFRHFGQPLRRIKDNRAPLSHSLAPQRLQENPKSALFKHLRIALSSVGREHPRKPKILYRNA